VLRLLAVAQVGVLLLLWVAVPLSSGADVHDGVPQPRPAAANALHAMLAGLADDGDDVDDAPDLGPGPAPTLLGLLPGAPQPTLSVRLRAPTSWLEPPPDPPPTSTV
jgi:hypothetical protein